MLNQKLHPDSSYIRKLGGLVIIDEVQTGLGRLGEYTWGFEMHGIVPDIMTTGKPLGNGHPLAITVSSEELANSLGIMKDMVSIKLVCVEIEIFLHTYSKKWDGIDVDSTYRFRYLDLSLLMVFHCFG